MLPERYKGSLVSFRNDRMGARILTLLNTIRIARDYDLPYFFTWVTHGRTSEELKSPTEIFDEDYFNAHFTSHEDFKLINAAAQDIQTLSVASTAETIKAATETGGALLCTGSELSVLPWENAELVADGYAKAISDLQFSAKVKEAMAALKETLAESGTAFHIRRGDIVYDPVTTNNLWSNKYIPREYYEVLARRLVQNPDARILVFSDEPKEIERLKALSDQIITPSEVIQDDLTLGQRDFIEIYAMSLCTEIIGPPGSGFSASAALIGNRPIRDIRDVLTEEENHQAMELLTERLEQNSPLFLSDGDVGQTFPFMLDYVNKVGNPARGLDILDSYAKRGFQKIYFFRLRMLQRYYCKRYGKTKEIFDELTSAKLDPAIPGRMDMQWSELSRIASVVEANDQSADLATKRIAMAIWFNGGNRLAYNTLSQLIDSNSITGSQFPIPFDEELFRPIPVAKPGAPLPPVVVVPNGLPTNQKVMPPDLIARDWQFWLGKTLNRGFDTEGAIKKALEMMLLQFGRSCPNHSVQSASGVYLSLLGKHAEAIKAQRAVLREFKDNPLYSKRLADALIRSDPENKEACDLYQLAFEKSGHLPIYRADLAQLHWMQGDRENGSEMMTETAQSSQFLVPEIPFVAARMHRQSGKVTDQTLDLIDQALAKAPYVRRLMLVGIHVLCDLGRKSEASDRLNQVIERFGFASNLVPVQDRVNGR